MECKKPARHTGLLHDLGKYTPEFAARLRLGKSVVHATVGAKIAAERRDAAGKLMAFCIAGHHAGLVNGDGEGDNRRTLVQHLALQFGKDIPELDSVWQQEIALPEKLPAPSLKADARQKWFSYIFFTRMLYFCSGSVDNWPAKRFFDAKTTYARQKSAARLDALLKARRIEAIYEHTLGKQFYSLIGMDFMMRWREI